ncbi:unnamed protein product [Symbiodinium necroappetens]|uniref:Uncharacterized protein n=1 Tax=Symbiodinium necroappetens TaxID=1628268 RepID=A0A812J2Y7_9DINO|nr:unnamed protein product [Symbiodinium necroappetens]
MRPTCTSQGASGATAGRILAWQSAEIIVAACGQLPSDDFPPITGIRRVCSTAGRAAGSAVEKRCGFRSAATGHGLSASCTSCERSAPALYAVWALFLMISHKPQALDVSRHLPRLS